MCIRDSDGPQRAADCCPVRQPVQHALRDQSACAAAFLCDASARAWRGSARDSGAARTRCAVDHSAIHTRQFRAAAGRLSEVASSRKGDSVIHVAFLRAVNVGGKGLVKMADLQKVFTAAGAKNVRTVIASGNVIFDAPATLGPMRDRILKKVGALLGAEPVIVFRTLPYLQRLINAAPFGPLVNDRALK